MGLFRLATAVAAGLAVFAVVVALRALGALQPLELAVYDQYLRRARPAAGPSSVVVVEITEDDIREQGHWPISDRAMAEALQVLVDSGAQAIGLDLYRDLPVSPGEEMFRRMLREETRIIDLTESNNEGRSAEKSDPDSTKSSSRRRSWRRR